mmetsp:Transcript_8021/g.11608  ORF Transcript_8021/g.11608 Transcript_8021/m.11608 type:complete len:177 (-) Transcript_8021:788-1318(-)|eukprot:CAMPEP_0194242778 /NCGR_PEP_ID=MMETSP0158-20130606/8212_1 /TAXON_ID=33649 /ORGANISM="Thalassionema nitzschioides, Strain L26-B" /LENGTH=176 /DNA_ID=CAMNT_0038977937 /DNA_START=33 /DNA_END=563 /DNA_ORIENTATION=-
MVDHGLLFIYLLPSFVVSHYCPRFTYSKALQGQQLPILAPTSFKGFISESAATDFVGVSDCHENYGESEVAMSAICETETIAFTRSDDSCMCQALFQFQGCSSCTLCQRTDENGFNIGSFSADCGGIDEKYPDCRIECGFKTSGCFPETNSGASGGRLAVSTSIPILVGILMFIIL